MTTSFQKYSVARHYLVISQLSSCTTVALVATYLDTRYWVVAVAGLVGWISQPVFVNVVTTIVGGLVPRPPTEEAAQQVWITRVMPAALRLLGAIALVCVGAVFFRMAPHGAQGAALFTAGLVAASLTLSFFVWGPSPTHSTPSPACHSQERTRSSEAKFLDQEGEARVDELGKQLGILREREVSVVRMRYFVSEEISTDLTRALEQAGATVASAGEVEVWLDKGKGPSSIRYIVAPGSPFSVDHGHQMAESLRDEGECSPRDLHVRVLVGCARVFERMKAREAGR